MILSLLARNFAVFGFAHHLIQNNFEKMHVKLLFIACANILLLLEIDLRLCPSKWNHSNVDLLAKFSQIKTLVKVQSEIVTIYLSC